MKIYHRFEDIEFNKNRVITLGTFDGVHRGHLKLIQNLIDIGNNNSLEHLFITIHPHPQIVIKKENKPKIHLLTTIEERIMLLENTNLENVFVLPFTYELSQTGGKDFIINYLYNQIGFKRILIGYDHNFGKNREGNRDLLEKLSVDYDFSIDYISAFSDDELIISSSKIRHYLLEKNIDTANQLLGYPYFITGTTVKGHNRGNKIGFPTANLHKNDEYKLFPANGVYLVYSIIEGRKTFGMANIGVRPTFDNDNVISLEIHFFGINREMYNEKLTVHFLKFIRDEKKFGSVDELVGQLKKDKEMCVKLSKDF